MKGAAATLRLGAIQATSPVKCVRVGQACKVSVPWSVPCVPRSPHGERDEGGPVANSGPALTPRQDNSSISGNYPSRRDDRRGKRGLLVGTSTIRLLDHCRDRQMSSQVRMLEHEWKAMWCRTPPRLGRAGLRLLTQETTDPNELVQRRIDDRQHHGRLT
jgi:hypothetical protein